MPACDDFEIMFNRPGGVLAEDIVPSYIFGDTVGGGDSEPVVTDDQWTALEEIADEFNLSHYTEKVPKTSRLTAARRMWFYTGGGLPLDDDGSLNTHAQMHNRVVGPATPAVYKAEILDEWTSKSTNYRCLFLDAMVQCYGQMVALVHDANVYNNFTVVGEAIPGDEHARAGAPWYASLEAPKAPWWRYNQATPPYRDKNFGYDTGWTSDWDSTPVYFGVENNGYPYLHIPPGTTPPLSRPGDGSNMSIGDIYKFILKGATPICRVGTYRKVGAAWNLAMRRVPLNSWDRTGRASRVQR